MRRRFNDLTGKRFGGLVVLGSSKNKKYHLEVKCDCGNKIEVFKYSLMNGHTTSCGCYQREQLSKRCRLEGNLYAKNQAYLYYKKNALKKNISFELTIDQFLELVQKNCWYCGVEPSNIVRTPTGEFMYQGIDRQNNELGYIIGNVVPCCKICNTAKSNRSSDEFIEWVERIINRRKNESQRFFGARRGINSNCSDPFFC